MSGTEAEVGEDPEDIADAVSWGSDQFQLLFLLLSLPAFLISIQVLRGRLLILADLVLIGCLLIIGATFAFVIRQDSPEAYADEARIGRIPVLRRLLGWIPIVRDGSAAVFVCALVSILTGLAVAYLTPH